MMGKTTIKELIIYIVFLTNLCILTVGMSSSSMFYYTRMMTDLFVDASTENFGKTFRGMTVMTDFWDFANGPMLDGLFWEQNVTGDDGGYIYHENKLLGRARLRQLRVRAASCAIPDAFKREIKECFNEYSDTVEETGTFGLGSRNGTAWNHQTEKELDGTSFWGKVTKYDGGGYVQELGGSRDEAVKLLEKLKAGRWLDRGTRAVFLDFTVYNANINLFCVVKLVVEFPATGGVLPSWTMRTVKLIRYASAFDFFILACEAIFVIFMAYYLIEEFSELRKMKFEYFKQPWNLLDIFMALIAVCCMAFSVFRQLLVDKKLTILLENDAEYANFEFLSFAQVRFNDAVAVLVFFAWLKIFKYISFNKTMNQLSSTLSRCAGDVGGFAVMFFIFFFAYAQLGYLVFGSQVKDFSTFNNAVFTLLRTILGDFNFHELEQANRVLGPIFFITYVFFVFFVLLNMFLAIINDTYAEVKAELAEQKNEFDLTEYFKRGYDNMMKKLNIKKDRVVDISQALAAADVDGDAKVDFDEWRAELKKRGYAEVEIEAMFAKYDVDGDRTLDVQEIHQMQDDLDNTKRALDDEIGKSHGTDEFRDFDDPSTAISHHSHRRTGAGRNYGTEVKLLNTRVDGLDASLANIVMKLDKVTQSLENMGKLKMKHGGNMAKILEKKDQMDKQPVEMMVKGELDRFDKDEESAM